MFGVENNYKAIPEEKHTNKYFNKKIINIIIAIIIMIALVFVISIIINKNRKQDDYESKKQDIAKDYVYTVKTNKTNTGKMDLIPFINIKGEEITKINNEIEEYYKNYLNAETDFFNYKFSRSNNILSLLIITKSKKELACYNYAFKTYNINLNNNTILTDKDILKIYGITEYRLSFYLSNKYLEKFNKLVSLGYYDKNVCDYSCYLRKIQVYDFSFNNSLYIKNNSLYVYNGYNSCIESDNKYNYKETDFKFLIRGK